MAIKTAIIGLGIMGRRMLAQMQAHPGFSPQFLWDPNTAACQAAQAEAPDALIAATAEAAIIACDLVYLACPPAPRKAFALMAAKAGKAVFLEKPLGIDIDESRDLVAQLQAFNVPAAVNFTQAAGPALTDVATAAANGDLGKLVGADIVVTYGAWPREWQKAADWLRFRAEGGMTREVISHFLFFSERILGPLQLVWARPDYPDDPTLCETGMLARLQGANGCVVNVLASVGGAQPDRQELTIKGLKSSRRISNFYQDSISDGGEFVPVAPKGDPRSVNLQAQLGDLVKLLGGQSNRLATPAEALRVQILIEAMLNGKS